MVNNMNKRNLISFFAISIMLLSGSTYLQAQDNSFDKQALTMLREFYTSYITEISKAGPPNEKKLNALKRKFCTTSLLKKIEKEEMDFDPFLKAQDSDASILKTLAFKKEPQKNSYVASYVDNNSGNSIAIHLKVINENNALKISSIK